MKKIIMSVALLMLPSHFVYAELNCNTNWHYVYDGKILQPDEATQLDGCKPPNLRCAINTTKAFVQAGAYNTMLVFCDLNDPMSTLNAGCVQGNWLILYYNGMGGPYQGCADIGGVGYCPKVTTDVVVVDKEKKLIYGSEVSCMPQASGGTAPAPEQEPVSGSAASSGGASEIASLCPVGQAPVKFSEADLTASFKCTAITDLDKDGKCPAGQVVTDAQVCAAVTASSGGAAGGSASAKSPTKESASVSSAASSGPCPSGQSLQSAKKCVALLDLSTDPGADGNCAKDQVMYYVNDVKKCAPAAVMEKDATVPKNQEAAGGGSGCSLIR